MLIPTCPKCGHELDTSTCVSREKAAMVAGDFSICFYCLAILRFYNSSIHVGGLGLLECVEESVPLMVIDARDDLRRFKLSLTEPG